MQHCSCDNSCPNRVAQLPRDFPIQIFKTVKYGWGARCPVDLVKGKVLGIYSGMLMFVPFKLLSTFFSHFLESYRSREFACKRNGEVNAYSFDLDARELHDDNGEDDDLAKYTIDARDYGECSLRTTPGK